MGTGLPVCLVIIIYIAIGTLAYRGLEPDWTTVDAFYFSFVTSSTVGYGCIAPTNRSARAFTIAYTVCSVPFMGGALSALFRPMFKWMHHQVRPRAS